jgi:hypothetical protein
VRPWPLGRTPTHSNRTGLSSRYKSELEWLDFELCWTVYFDAFRKTQCGSKSLPVWANKYAVGPMRRSGVRQPRSTVAWAREGPLRARPADRPDIARVRSTISMDGSVSSRSCFQAAHAPGPY